MFKKYKKYDLGKYIVLSSLILCLVSLCHWWILQSMVHMYLLFDSSVPWQIERPHSFSTVFWVVTKGYASLKLSICVVYRAQFRCIYVCPCMLVCVNYTSGGQRSSTGIGCHLPPWDKVSSSWPLQWPGRMAGLKASMKPPIPSHRELQMCTAILA